MRLPVLLLLPLAAVALELHVDPAGDDRWSGRLPAPTADRRDGPLATLEAARDAGRRLRKPGEALTVYLHGGIHRRLTTLELTRQDGGTAKAPVTWMAWREERPLLQGSRPVIGWTAQADGRQVADLRAQALLDLPARLAFVGQRRLTLARWPNEDPAKPITGGWAEVDGARVAPGASRPDDDRRRLVAKPEDVRRWSVPTEVEVVIFPRHQWWNDVLAVARQDPATRTVTVATDASWAIRPGDPYYVRGAREDLDAPGEWHLDRTTGRLAVIPRPGEEVQQVHLPVVRDLIVVRPGTAHLRIVGLTLEAFAGTAITLQETQDNLVARCTIRLGGDLGGDGIRVDGGRANRIVGNDLSDLGRHGIAVSGGDPIALTEAGHVVENNHIHHTGVEYKQGVGISLRGCGLRATSNLIHHTPRMGILFHGTRQIVEFNRLHHTNQETYDSGAIYTYGRNGLDARGSVIRHNFISDSLGYGPDGSRGRVTPFYAWGIYLDDGTSGVDVVGNVVVRCSQAGIHLHNARDNRIEGNLLAANGVAQIEANGWHIASPTWQGLLPEMLRTWEAAQQVPAWRKVPGLRLRPDRWGRPDGTLMEGNRLTKNIIACAPGSQGFLFTGVDLDGLASDRNLVWANGAPVPTGIFHPAERVGPNRAPDLGAAPPSPGQLPPGWSWADPAPAGVAVRRDQGAGGQGTLRLDLPAGFPGGTLLSDPQEVERGPGRGLDLGLRVRTDGAPLAMDVIAQHLIPEQSFWWHPRTVIVQSAWRTATWGAALPGPEVTSVPARLAVRLHLRLPTTAAARTVWLASAVLQEAQGPDAWASWQAQGLDQASVVADPGFADPARDDWTPAKDTARRIGFAPLPMDKMGLYADPLRASWPVQDP